MKNNMEDSTSLSDEVNNSELDQSREEGEIKYNIWTNHLFGEFIPWVFDMITTCLVYNNNKHCEVLILTMIIWLLFKFEYFTKNDPGDFKGYLNINIKKLFAKFQLFSLSYLIIIFQSDIPTSCVKIDQKMNLQFNLTKSLTFGFGKDYQLSHPDDFNMMLPLICFSFLLVNEILSLYVYDSLLSKFNPRYNSVSKHLYENGSLTDEFILWLLLNCVLQILYHYDSVWKILTQEALNLNQVNYTIYAIISSFFVLLVPTGSVNGSKFLTIIHSIMTACMILFGLKPILYNQYLSLYCVSKLSHIIGHLFGFQYSIDNKYRVIHEFKMIKHIVDLLIYMMMN